MIKKISDKKKARMKEQVSEVEFYHQIWWDRIHICEACKHLILYPWYWSFAHKISKTQYPQFKFIEENIAFVCDPVCHKKIDSLYVKEKRKEFADYLIKNYGTKV